MVCFTIQFSISVDTPKYNVSQASFSPFRSLIEKAAWERGYTIVRPIRRRTGAYVYTLTLYMYLCASVFNVMLTLGHLGNV